MDYDNLIRVANIISETRCMKLSARDIQAAIQILYPNNKELNVKGKDMIVKCIGNNTLHIPNNYNKAVSLIFRQTRYFNPSAVYYLSGLL